MASSSYAGKWTSFWVLLISHFEAVLLSYMVDRSSMRMVSFMDYGLSIEGIMMRRKYLATKFIVLSKESCIRVEKEYAAEVMSFAH